MKQILLLVIVCLSIINSVYAQNTIKYNFETKEPPIIPESKLGENTIYKIENINKFLYDVKITAKQTEYNSEPPAVFAQVFKIEKKEESAVGKEAEKVNTEQTDADEVGFSQTKSNEESYLFLNELKLEAYSQEIKEIESISDSLQDDGRLIELKLQVEKLNKAIVDQQETISELNAIISDEYSKIIQQLYSRALILHNSYEVLEEAKLIKNKLVIISMTDGLSFQEYSSKTKKILLDYPYAKNPDNLLSSFNRSYRQFKSAYQLYLVNEIVKQKFSSDEDKIISNINPLLTEIEELKTKTDKFNYSELFQNLNILFTELQNKNNFFVASDPIQAEKDVINFNIKISPRKNINSSSVLETRNFPTNVPIKGGVKIDFSTGLFITTGLYDREYNTSVSASDSTMSIISENTNNSIAQLSLGALMHISPRWTSSFKPGFTFGFGLNSNDLSNANVFIGASAMFGNQERFIISTGVSLANVNYLNGKFQLDSNIETSKLNVELTEKVTKAGWFVSFTYNLTNKKKE